MIFNFIIELVLELFFSNTTDESYEALMYVLSNNFVLGCRHRQLMSKDVYVFKTRKNNFGWVAASLKVTYGNEPSKHGVVRYLNPKYIFFVMPWTERPYLDRTW